MSTFISQVKKKKKKAHYFEKSDQLSYRVLIMKSFMRSYWRCFSNKKKLNETYVGTFTLWYDLLSNFENKKYNPISSEISYRVLDLLIWKIAERQKWMMMRMSGTAVKIMISNCNCVDYWVSRHDNEFILKRQVNDHESVSIIAESHTDHVSSIISAESVIVSSMSSVASVEERTWLSVSTRL